ncbi:MAG: EAL domain-containing protein [Eubacteriales bacterium]|nr:EAL domain-containing protein [Eubacteriales bacterium]
MEELIKNEFGMSKGVKISFAAGLTIFFFISIFVYYSLYNNIEEIVTAQTINSITNISELNVDAVSRAIANRKTLLEAFAINLERKQSKDYDAILREMETYRTTYDFYSMGILDEDMIFSLTTGEKIDVSELVQFQNAWRNEFYISDSYMPADGGEKRVNLFSYPVRYGNECQYRVIATYLSKNLTERMNIRVVNGKGYYYILDTDGDVAIYPRYYKDENYLGLMEYVNDTPEIIPDETGNRYFQYNGENYYAHFEQLDINDWYLMTCVKETDMFADADKITYGVFVGMGLLWLMIVGAMFFVLMLVYQFQKKMQRAVFYDSFLKIGNGEMLSVFFQKIPKEKFPKMAFTIFDIDKFKEFNYVHGEETGDNLLKYIVHVFRDELPDDYLFRYRADNFVVLIVCEDKTEFIQKMEKVLQRFSDDIDAGLIQSFDISAGVRRMRDGDSLQRIMSDALLAKGTIKGIQVQQYAFYDENFRAKKMNFMEMESDFSRALKNKEFHVYYQPKFDMETGKIVGAEALARWIKCDGTIVYPGEFIPCFEASRQIIMLDEAMLEAVCRQMKEMEADGLNVKKVSVNLSRVHLKHSGILQKIERIVTESGVNPGMISFEITESALYEDSIPLRHIVDFLHRLGCKVDMDDYGIGVSGPNALASNQFDVIKLDKSFIDGIGNRRIESVIRSTIFLSKDLGIDILAEGVEEKYQADSLLKWGCTLAQGYYYSPPVPEEQYREMLKKES